VNVDSIIGKENLIEKINRSIIKVRNELLSKGYAEYEADMAIAGALPNCITTAVNYWKQFNDI
jgi:uncharacterized protein YegL